MGVVVDLDGKDITTAAKKDRRIQKVLLDTLKLNRKGNLKAVGIFTIRDDGWVTTKLAVDKSLFVSQLVGAVENLKDHCKND